MATDAGNQQSQNSSPKLGMPVYVRKSKKVVGFPRMIRLPQITACNGTRLPTYLLKLAATFM